MSILEKLKSVGIVDALSNNNYVESLMKNGVSEESKKLLNEDDVDINELWEVARQIDQCSIVGGKMVNDNKSPDEIKFFANLLAKNIGAEPNLFLTAQLFEAKGLKANLLECGAGYGNIHELYRDIVNYYGFDVVKSFDECHLSNGRDIPEQLYKENFYDIIYSCNVFQHIKYEQKKKYIEDFSRLISKNGTLILAFSVKSQLNSLTDTNNNAYCYTVGQLTKLDTHEEIVDLLYDNNFYIALSSRRYDGFHMFMCKSRKYYE